MDRRKQLKQFIRRAKRSLNLEHSLPKLQYGILLAFLLSAAILLVSRLFIFPYYNKVAMYVSVGTLLAVAAFIWWKRVRDKEAIHRLDSFYPHNELLTAFSLENDSNPLASVLMAKANNEASAAFNRFKNRKKSLWKPKVLAGIFLVAIVIGALSIFPSATQQQAFVIEQEQEVVKDLGKEVAKLEEKSETKETKKQLEELQSKLKELDSSEEALREVVKKQKELKLQEQKLKEKQEVAKQDSGEGIDGLTTEEQEQLDELMELQKELADTADSTQTALSKLGKPISFDLQNAIASEMGSESASENSSMGEQNDSDGQQNDSQENKDGNQNSGQSGQGQSQGQGQGNGNGSSGQGGGTGKGGSGKGNGSGNGAGLGQGSRDLLSIPERVGGNSDTKVDGGSLGEGTAAGEQKGPVPVTKGTVKSYEEVIGDYKDSYIESSDRMQLPKDLQDIVQSYFSSIESE